MPGETAIKRLKTRKATKAKGRSALNLARRAKTPTGTAQAARNVSRRTRG